MPNGNDSARIVIDETSFNFSGLLGEQLTDMLHEFNEAIVQLRAKGDLPHKPPYFENTPCYRDHDLYDYLTSALGRGIDRDTKFRFYSLMQKCPEWDASVPTCDRVTVDDGEPHEAWSIAYALTMALQRRGVACLSLQNREQRGFLPVAAEPGRARIYFFCRCEDLPDFWRSLFSLENVTEREFFSLAREAFPRLIFHESLTFRRFQGAYRDLRDLVVLQLSVLNDYFLQAYLDHQGNPRAMKMAMAEQGCDGLSPESPNTRGNGTAMRLRDVAHNGKVYRCEWHMKLKPHVERIHFAFGGDLHDHILIGIFVDHLAV